MTAEEILLGAADLIEQPGKWTQGWFAKTDTGRECTSGSPSAVCWCAEGAVAFTGRGSEESARWDAYVAANDAADGNLALFNDEPGRTSAEVAAKLREAAKAASA